MICHATSGFRVSDLAGKAVHLVMSGSLSIRHRKAPKAMTMLELMAPDMT
jgi:hypothetical protein